MLTTAIALAIMVPVILAQATPNETMSSPLVRPTVAPTPAGAAGNTAPGPISLSITPIYELNTGRDLNPKRSAFTPYGETALGFRFGFDVTRRLTVYWNRGKSLAINGRSFTPNGPAYSQLSDDNNDSYGVSYALTKTLSVDAGYTRRWRINFPAAGDPANASPTVYSGGYLAAAWSFGPDTIAGKPFSIFATVVDTDHRLNDAARLAFSAQRPNERIPAWQILCSTCGVAVRIPIGHQTIIIPKAAYYYASNDADSLPYPPIGNLLEFGLDIAPKRWVTISAVVRNYQAHDTANPAPFPFPAHQPQHYSYVNISANFHVRLELPK
jgi:hypothetical protein